MGNVSQLHVRITPSETTCTLMSEGGGSVGASATCTWFDKPVLRASRFRGSTAYVAIRVGFCCWRSAGSVSTNSACIFLPGSLRDTSALALVGATFPTGTSHWLMIAFRLRQTRVGPG